MVVEDLLDNVGQGRREVKTVKQFKPGERVIDEAKLIITQDRLDQYGNAENSFEDIAMLWTWWLKDKLAQDKSIAATDVAKMLALMKDAREKCGKGKKDNSVDRIGYEALYASLKGYESKS